MLSYYLQDILLTPHRYFLTICATGPLSLPTIHGIHLIILSAWWHRNSTLSLGDSIPVLPKYPQQVMVYWFLRMIQLPLIPPISGVGHAQVLSS